MLCTSYAVIIHSDMKALYAYFIQGVAPVDLRPQKNALPFPFNIRLSMAVWDSLYAGATPFVADAGHSAEWNRRAHRADWGGYSARYRRRDSEITPTAAVNANL